jgi:hypothetical protein
MIFACLWEIQAYLNGNFLLQDCRYSLPSIIRMIKSRSTRVAEHVTRMGGERNAYRLLVGKPEGKRPLGRPTRRWMDNIKMDIEEIGWDGCGFVWPRIGTSEVLL